jgi:hypothetical protein
MEDQPVCEIQKNGREVICFLLWEYQGHKFVDIRIFIIEPEDDGSKPKDPIPTKKGQAVSPTLWPEFKKALAQVEAAIIQEGWLDREDLEVQG